MKFLSVICLLIFNQFLFIFFLVIYDLPENCLKKSIFKRAFLCVHTHAHGFFTQVLFRPNVWTTDQKLRVFTSLTSHVCMFNSNLARRIRTTSSKLNTRTFCARFKILMTIHYNRGNSYFKLIIK